MREEVLDFATDLSAVYQTRESHTERLPPGEIALVSPFDWSTGRKWITLAIACFATVFASVAPSAYAPGEEQMGAEWNVSKVAAAVGVTTFTMGFAIAPMTMAPVSEVVGRKPVFMSMGVVYVVCTICCGATQLYSG